MIRTTILVVACCGAGAAAQTWTEGSDAGDLPGTAQGASGSGMLSAIVGVLSTHLDVDLFRIRISNPAAFSATTDNGVATWDTQLFLFDAAGMGIAANDDIVVATNLRSALPVGNALYSGLPAGEYLLAISRYNVDAANGGDRIFATNTTGVVGPTGPGGGSPLTAWTGTGSVGANFGYRIDLRGAEFLDTVVIPLPSAGVMALAGVGLVGLRRRRG